MERKTKSGKNLSFPQLSPTRKLRLYARKGAPCMQGSSRDNGLIN